MPPLDLTALWDFADPAGSEARMRAALAGAGDEDAAILRTQIARTHGLRRDFVRAREYLGEGYAAAGKLDLAKAQLAEIEKRCGKSCEEYEDLSKAISAATN